ncbi:hypothetical protein C8P64_3311 [Christiangramia gaetbulicola]|uniref:GLPGLI family protein n=1 Tax=Christiangramia gaetbulicola TaxID=703340 RepID=A0A2T6ACG3_9FLAO|nr:hypothetical protein [Christiangramia gaetbulicola]PTX41511.1 hypothetical protein C8P64_3311 [Christiangramia gaetbulicola]
MKAITLSAFFIFSVSVFSQTSYGTSTAPSQTQPVEMEYNNYNIVDEINRWAMNPFTITENYIGSPYLTEDFQKGKIISGGKEQSAFLRYDVLHKKMEIKISNESEITAIPINQFKTYILDDYKLSWKNLLMEEGLRKGYFFTYFDNGDIRLYGFPSILLKEAEAETSGYSGEKPAHYTIEMNYYLSTGDSVLQRIRLRNKDFEKSLGLDAEAEKFLNKHKIKEVSDAVEFLEFYSSI